MNIQAEKLKLIEQLLKTESAEILSKVKAIFQKDEEVDFWVGLTEGQRAEINGAIKEISKGDVVEYENVVAKFR